MNINSGLHNQRRKGGFKFMRYQPHIRCNIAYTPWPIALLYLFLPQQHYIFCPSVYPTFSEHEHRPSRSLSGLWVNPFSRWVVRLCCHNQLCVPTCLTSSHENPNGRFGGVIKTRTWLIKVMPSPLLTLCLLHIDSTDASMLSPYVRKTGQR